MDLNQVRILEACHKYLNGQTSFETELADDCLVFDYNGTLYKFDTSQEQPRFDTFVDYELMYYRIEPTRKYIDKIEDLIDAFHDTDALESLQSVQDIEQARIQIFKLLSTVNLDELSEKYPRLKTDNLVYDVYNLDIDKEFSIYQFPNDATFVLVSLD